MVVPVTLPVNKMAKVYLFPAFNDGKWGYIDSDGQVVIAYQFEKAELFSNHLGLIRFSGKWGFNNQEGKYEINPQFKAAYNHSYPLMGWLKVN